MILSDIVLLRCPDCREALEIGSRIVQDGEALVAGTLSCKGCHHNFLVFDTVVILFRRSDVGAFLNDREKAFIDLHKLDICQPDENVVEGPDDRLIAVASNWSYQWNEVETTVDLDGDGFYGARAFWSFIPLDALTLLDKVALVTCGGLGREAYHLAAAGARRVVVNEIGDEIYRIRALVPDADHRLLLVRSDMSHLPLMPGSVDFAICDHALQHVIDHSEAFARLAETVRPGGRVAICVYSHENNVLMTYLVEPTKVILKWVPIRILRYAAVLPAAILWCVIYGVYKPASALAPTLSRRLPLFEHLMFWARFPFSFLWTSIFDLLHAPVSYHFTHSELERLAADNGLEIECLHNTNGTLWSLVARVPGQAEA